MDASAMHRFVATNVAWPTDEKFFIPDGRLSRFLQTNLRFKVFLVMIAVFKDAYASGTVPSLTTAEIVEVRLRMKDIVRHMFYAAHIRQNEFRVASEPPRIPAESAWMFHVLLVLLHAVGFEGDSVTVAVGDLSINKAPSEGRLAHAQASFFLGGALQTYLDSMKEGKAVMLDYPEYDENGWVSKNFAYRSRPSDFLCIAVDDSTANVFRLNSVIADWRQRGASANNGHAAEIVADNAAAQGVGNEGMDVADAATGVGITSAVKSVRRALAKRSPTRRSLRVLAEKIEEDASKDAVAAARFFINEEERARSEASYGSLPELQSVSDSD
ncbi:hypothetical protein C8R44DRAFT_881487 [Mycena epipterygia]|nr:hypothetical protein C8R44DRAFT_881487 [Mycena epipterygia]